MEKSKLEKYISQGLNDSEIAKAEGCHRTTIGKLKKKFSIEIEKINL